MMSDPTAPDVPPQFPATAGSAYGIGFMRGRLIELDRQREAAQREVEKLNVTVEHIRAALSRLEGK